MGNVEQYKINVNTMKELEQELFQLNLKNSEFLIKQAELNNRYNLLFLQSQDLFYNKLSEEERDEVKSN